MTWMCKICKQIQVDPYYGDGICEDCFDKMKREEKKQKRRNSPFFRFLSFVLALSLMLCIFSGIGVAGAEGLPIITYADTKFTAKFKGYDLIKVNPNEHITYQSFISIYDNYVSQNSNINYMYTFLIDFDSEGKPHVYSYASNRKYLSVMTEGTIVNTHRIFYGDYSIYDSAFDPNTSSLWYTAHCSFYYDETSFHCMKLQSNATIPEIVTRAFTHTDGLEGFNGFHSSDRYLLFIPLNDDEQSISGLLNTALMGTKDNDFVPSVTTPTYTAKFHSFASMNDGGETLNMLDWLGLGQQYPIADFSINDNGQLHSYSLRISSNKNYVDVCMGLWEDYKNNNITSAWGNGLGIFLSVKEIAKVVAGKAVLGTLGPIGALLITFPIETGTVQAIRTIAQYNLLNSIGDLSYVTEYNLTNSYLQFQEGESSSRAYSVCLADYVSIVKGLLYKLEIVDNNTGLILDTAYFCNDTTFAKTNTGYGTKVYNYSDYNDLLGDVDNGNGYINNDSYTQGDSLHNDNPNDIVDWDKYNQYDFTNIQNLTGTLNSATAGLGGFFMACYNIIPPVFVSILLGTFTLVIILRVLGR